MKLKGIAARIIANTIRDAGGCWVWASTFRHDSGRAVVATRDGEVDVRRWLWRCATGRSVPAGRVLAHCPRHPRCVHPAHQSLRTRAEINRGRAVAA